jgi:hypothetical protein
MELDADTAVQDLMPEDYDELLTLFNDQRESHTISWRELL